MAIGEHLRKNLKKNVSKTFKCWELQCPKAAKKPCWARHQKAFETGLNIHGYFLSEIGLGESARLLAKAADTQTFKSTFIHRKIAGRENNDAFEQRLSSPSALNTSLSIIGLPEIAQLKKQLCRSQHNIVYPFWELEKLPLGSQGSYSAFDSFWAPSQFIFDCLASQQERPVHLVKQPVDVPDIEPELGLGGGKLKILTYFDYDSFAARKNPEGAVKAFRCAFPAHQTDVELTVKSRGQLDAGRRAWLTDQAAQDPRIMVIDATLTNDQMKDLMLDNDVFLSLHRSEGFGLGCAEALISGRAVVSTDYGGTRDFINNETGYPVEWEWLDLHDGDYIGWEGARWADPSIEHASEILRQIYNDPESAQRRTRQGFQLLRDQHSFEVIGKRISEVLKSEGVSVQL